MEVSKDSFIILINNTTVITMIFLGNREDFAINDVVFMKLFETISNSMIVKVIQKFTSKHCKIFSCSKVY